MVIEKTWQQVTILSNPPLKNAINSKGQIQKEKQKKKLGLIYRDEWSTWSTILNFRVAHRFGYREVWLEGDAIYITRVIDEKECGFSPLFLIFDDICDLSKLFNVFVISLLRGRGIR